MKHRKGLSATDRAARSQLRKLLEDADGMAHGSLIQMVRRCGNPHCRCATKDQKHRSWYLGVTQNRTTRMKHIPKAQEGLVRRWVQAYQQARSLLDQISTQAWKRLADGKE
jgi:hypothetical protein